MNLFLIKGAIAKIIAKIIDILDLVFQKPRLERQKFYDKTIYDAKEINF
jgi:hypothetical protein